MKNKIVNFTFFNQFDYRALLRNTFQAQKRLAPENASASDHPQ